MPIKICIDAGHYGKYNRSPVVPEYYESDMNWKLHLLLKKYLEEKGFEVITTRKSQGKDLSLYNRGASARGCDLFLSLHSNAAYSTSEVEDGRRHKNEPVDRVDIYAPIDGRAHDLAKKLADKIHKVMETSQKGYVKTRKSGSGGEYYGVIRGAVAVGVPGLLVEHSFHTNERAAKWLLDDVNLDKLARAEAEVLAAYYADKQSNSKDTSERMLRKGDEGDDVAALQEQLNNLGYPLGNYGPDKNGVDGDFGKKTDEAVRRFQKDQGLDTDGIVGPKTLAALKAAIAQKAALYQLVIQGDEETLLAIQKKYGGAMSRIK